MIKVTDTVLEIIKSDELALESLRAGLLNLSAYADKIHSKVENATFKEIKKGTIVVALSRISKNLPESPSLLPEVKIKNLSFKSGLSSLTFPKTVDIQRKISVLNPFHISINELIAVTEGISEITLIISEEAKEKILKHFGTKPKAESNNLVAVTATLPKELSEVPNVYFALFNSLASKRVNIIEVVATDSEITFVIKKEEMEETISALNLFFSKTGS